MIAASLTESHVPASEVYHWRWNLAVPAIFLVLKMCF